MGQKGPKGLGSLYDPDQRNYRYQAMMQEHQPGLPTTMPHIFAMARPSPNFAIRPFHGGFSTLRGR